jgi:hypothetical protein
MSLKFLNHCRDNLELIKSSKDQCHSLKALCKVLGYSEHGRNTGALSKFCKEYEIDISHFTSTGVPRVEVAVKVCPMCGIEFSTRLGGKKEKVTCSHLCANNYFKQAQKDEVGPEQYSIRAKRMGMDSCCVCGEREVLDIHHIDMDRSNNTMDNLMPLCPTHHMYIHRGKLDLIIDRIEEYLDKRIIGD